MEARRRDTEGDRRLGAARLKEYVLPRALEQPALVEKVLQRIEQLEVENRDVKSLLQRLCNIEAAVKELQRHLHVLNLEGPQRKFLLTRRQ